MEGLSTSMMSSLLTLNLLDDVDRSHEDFDAVVASAPVGGVFDEEKVVGAGEIGLALDACPRRGS